MTVELANFDGGGSFFSPAKVKDAHALLVEPTHFVPQAPSQYGPKDQVTAKITVFRTAEELENGTPSEIMQGSKIQQTALAGNLANFIGKGVVVTVGQANSKAGQNAAWIWVTVSPEVQKKVAYYVGALEAELDEAPF